jgi:anti-sigma regulatory factor (Ser/Thr protein kinase)
MARHIVAEALRGWELDDLVPDAELVVSEIVTNAIEHAPPADSLELTLVATEGAVRVAIADGSSVAPLIREMSADRPGGLGLQIVNRLAAGWGWEPHEGGKRVWVDLQRPL